MSTRHLPGRSRRNPIPISVVAKRISLFIDKDTGVLTLRGEGPIAKNAVTFQMASHLLFTEQAKKQLLLSLNDIKTLLKRPSVAPRKRAN
jgi:hypothetical protein